MTAFKTRVRQDTDEIYTRDRRAHARTARLMETEARMSREAWGRSMDASDLARAEETAGDYRDVSGRSQEAEAARKGTEANVDSRLVANQVNETYVAKEADMVCYLEKVKALTGSFKAFTIKQIPRSENKKADALSKIASTSFAHLSKQVLVEELKEKSISEVEVLTVVEEEGDTWMTPIYKYLAEETLPADMKKARAIKCKSWRFAVINGILYKKSFLGPWLRHMIRHGQGFADQLLLAYHAQRRKSVNKSMLRLSSS
ncbi:reverse transcriptase domain-containing protein [Tanacetum coccineum]